MERKLDINLILHECLANLKSLGEDFNSDFALLNPEIELFNEANVAGYCFPYIENDKIKIKIKLHEWLLAELNIEYLKSVLYHELCHFYQYEFWIKTGKLFIQNNKFVWQSTAIFQYQTEQASHNDFWYYCANTINNKLFLTVPIKQAFTKEQMKQIELNARA